MINKKNVLECQAKTNKSRVALEDYKRASSVNSIKIITQTDIDNTISYASSLKRAREPILVHESFEEVPQRFVNCLNSKSYVRPHMHIVPNQWELMCGLSGEVIAFIFDANGTVTQKILMNEKNVRIIEIPPFCYHAFVAIKDGSYLEIRNCKYQPEIDRLYSAWSPAENSEQAEEYQKRLCVAEVGDKLVI